MLKNENGLFTYGTYRQTGTWWNSLRFDWKRGGQTLLM